MNIKDFIAAVEAAYGVSLPARYRQFLEGGEHEKLPRLRLIDGFVRGTFEVSFTDADLADILSLGENHAIQDIEDLDWPGEFGDFVPFATLSQPWVEDEDDDTVRSFLVVQVSDPNCPVLLWDYDGWSLYPLAKSLDDFTASRATGKKTDHSNMSTPYKAFAWVASDSDE